MRRILLCVASLFCIAVCIAQKRPLDHSVYDGWQHIGERAISNDGKWVVYTIDVQQGDNELVIQSFDGQYKKAVPRGYLAAITEDSRYVVFRIKPFYKETREARIKKKKMDDMPKDSIGIIELGKELIWKTPGVKNFKVPKQSSGWLVYQLEKTIDPAVKKNSDNALNKKTIDSLNRVIDSLQNIIQNNTRRPRNRDDETIADADGDQTPSTGTEIGTDLVIRNIYSGEETKVTNVLEYYFSKTGNRLLIEKSKDPKDSAGKAKVILYDLNTMNFAVLAEGNVDYKNFAMTDNGGRVAYVAEVEPRPKDLQHFYSLWYYDSTVSMAREIVSRFSPGMNLGMTVSENALPDFSRTGNRLFFGAATLPLPRDTNFIDFENPKLDIWHYNDDYLQTVQNFPARLKAAQQQSFLSVVDLRTQSIRQLGSLEVAQVLQTDEGDGERFVGLSDYRKRISSQWTGGTVKDVYSIDVQTGDTILVKADLSGQVFPSSTGKYILWYDRKAKNYFTWDGYTTRNITSSIKFPLWNTDSEVPDDPNPYGIMGWRETDSIVYIYDQYDVWTVDPTAEKRPLLFDGWNKDNRARQVTLRYIRTDPEERVIKKDQDMLFRVFDNKEKRSSLYRTTAGDNGDLRSVQVMNAVNYQGILRAAKTRAYIFTKETFKDSPDLYANQFDQRPADDVRLSFINPQQKNYNWGTAELVRWKAYDGKEATGIIYKPEDFDPGKKYPMIVYFYEKLSDGLYDYKEPAPIRSAINVPFFVSRGYIIFYPDIHYTTGHPGKNAYDYIVSGTRAMVKKGWVDSTNIALQGHSWGGYQAAQVATMTKLYKAVWAGAPVANMTSAYGGIRWESGISRQFQYEKTQSRIGATLWEKPGLYIENSPLFHLDKVTAPMVIMANDADGAVPWYQGIELFTGLRRLGKKVWMFNYNGQGHGLTQRQDMRDYQIRMQQFFDWILKGDKPAAWITDGLPAVKKGKEFGLELVD